MIPVGPSQLRTLWFYDSIPAEKQIELVDSTSDLLLLSPGPSTERRRDQDNRLPGPQPEQGKKSVFQKRM